MSAWIPGSKKVEPYSSSLSGTLTSWLAKRSWERNNHRGVCREKCSLGQSFPLPQSLPSQNPTKEFLF